MQRTARHNQYMAFLAVANAIGYGRVKQADIHSQATIDTDGAQEQATAGAEWTLSFYGEAVSVNALARKTQKPFIEGGKAIPNEYFIGFRALTVAVDQQITTHTVTELMEVAQKLSQSALEVASGPDVVLERRLGFLVSSFVGVEVREDGTNAAAGTANLTARGQLTKMVEGDDIDDPIVVFPGGSFSIRMLGEGPWTTVDDVVLGLDLHGWVGLPGTVDDKRKMLDLSQAYAMIQGGVASERLRALARV